MDLSPKQTALLKSTARVEFAEGTSASGKSHTLRLKMLLKCMASKYSTHVILGFSRGKIEDNLLGNPNIEGSFLHQFQETDHILEYYPNGHGQISDAHILLHCRNAKGQRVDKIIYVWGGGDISAVPKIRGGVYGCIYVDELNMINEDVAREACMRSNDWFCGSLNPDSPDKSIYKLVNQSRPLPEFADDIPKEILAMLNEKPQKNWTYWHFNFHDNPSLTEEDIIHKMSSFEAGTTKYNSLILGLRTKAEGVVFDCLSNKNLIEEYEIFKKLDNFEMRFDYFTAGLDTSFSMNTPDTNSLIFSGITSDGHIYILEEYVFNNRDLPDSQRVYASDLCPIIDKLMGEWAAKWGHFTNFYIDCADANMIGEYGKYRRTNGSNFRAIKCDKKTFNIKARNDKINEWLQTGYMHINKKCVHLISEFYTYAYDEKTGKPLDKNNHTVDAFNYSWTASLSNRIGQYNN